MTFDIAYFADLGGGLTSYPTDGHMQQVFRDLLAQAKNKVQIAVQRDGNLLHYGYIRQVGRKGLWGICVSCPAVVCDMVKWFNHMDNAFQHFVTNGVIVHFSNDGELILANTCLPDERMHLDMFTDDLLSRLTNDKSLKYSELPAASVAISKLTIAKHSIEDSAYEISNSLRKYYKIYIVKTSAEIELLTSYSHILREQSDTIDDLRSKYNKLKKQKGNKTIFFLIVVALVILNIWDRNELNDSKLSLQEKNEIIASRDCIISSRDSILSSLNIKLDETNSMLEKITSVYPIIITDIEIANTFSGGALQTDFGQPIYSSVTMFLNPKIHYIGYTSKIIPLDIKLFKPSGELSYSNKSPYGYSFSYSGNVYTGKNELILL